MDGTNHLASIPPRWQTLGPSGPTGPREGGRIFLQLWHMGRASHSSFHGGKRAVSASAIAINEEYIHTPIGKQPHEVPRALETDEIPRVVSDYQNAARRAKEAGFDGVEIHGANGYLSIVSAVENDHRTDAYGGSISKRYRFLDEVIQGVSAVFPAHRIGVRLSPNGAFNDMGSPDYREQFSFVAKELDRFGLAYLHVMDGLALVSMAWATDDLERFPRLVSRPHYRELWI